MDKNKVCIMGMGYVGLTLSVVLAEVSYEVWGVEYCLPPIKHKGT